MTAVDRMNEMPEPDAETRRLYELTELWGVGLVLLDVGGLTLWGSGGAGDGRDRLLLVDGKLALAPSEPALREFVSGDTRSSFSDLPGWHSLKERAAKEPGSWLYPEVTFDYRAVAAKLNEPVEIWRHSDWGDLLSALNMLSDAADALADKVLQEAFDRPSFATLQERLTFLDERQLPGAVSDLDLDAIGELVGLGMARVQRQLFVIPDVASTA